VEAAVGDFAGVGVFFEAGAPPGVGVFVDVGVRVGVPAGGSMVEPSVEVAAGSEAGVGVSPSGVEVAVGVGVLVAGGKISTREAESTYAVMTPPGTGSNATRNSTNSTPVGATAPETDRIAKAPGASDVVARGG